MKASRLGLLATGISAALLLVSGCKGAGSDSRSNCPQQGAFCLVQFRRDALGASAPLPIPPTTGVINGASVNVSGTFRAMDADWVVLTLGTGKEYWIPRGMILLMEIRNPRRHVPPAAAGAPRSRG